MSTGAKVDARRRRILQKGEDRLALITGRKPNLSSDAIDINNDINNNDNNLDSSPPFIPHQHSYQDLRSTLPSVSRPEEDKPTSFTSNQASGFTQEDAILVGQTKKGSVPMPMPVRKPDPSRASPSEDRIKVEAPSAVHKVLEIVLGLINKVPIKNISSQQAGIAVLETENDRLLCAITLAILAVLSCAGLPVFGTKLFTGFLLFRPLFLVIIINITLITCKLLPESRRQVIRGDKDANSLPLGDDYAWAEEAGRALELGLVLQSLTGALFMDCSVYATIAVFGIALFG